MRRNGFSLWSRPVLSWDLKCESEGLTRRFALSKAEMRLADSGGEKHVGRTSIAILVVVLGIPCIIGIILIGVKSFVEAAATAAYACTRCAWIILAPIMFTYLSYIRGAAEENYESADEYIVITKCADPRAHVDTCALRGA